MTTRMPYANLELITDVLLGPANRHYRGGGLAELYAWAKVIDDLNEREAASLAKINPKLATEHAHGVGVVELGRLLGLQKIGIHLDRDDSMREVVGELAEVFSGDGFARHRVYASRNETYRARAAEWNDALQATARELLDAVSEIRTTNPLRYRRAVITVVKTHVVSTDVRRRFNTLLGRDLDADLGDIPRMARHVVPLERILPALYPGDELISGELVRARRRREDVRRHWEPVNHAISTREQFLTIEADLPFVDEMVQAVDRDPEDRNARLLTVDQMKAFAVRHAISLEQVATGPLRKDFVSEAQKPARDFVADFGLGETLA